MISLSYVSWRKCHWSRPRYKGGWSLLLISSSHVWKEFLLWGCYYQEWNEESIQTIVLEKWFCFVTQGPLKQFWQWGSLQKKIVLMLSWSWELFSHCNASVIFQLWLLNKFSLLFYGNNFVLIFSDVYELGQSRFPHIRGRGRKYVQPWEVILKPSEW